MPKYRIRDWDLHFENAGSRKLKRLDWVAIPNKMDGEGYTALVEHKNAAAHLGAWYAIVEIASKQSPRGNLPGGISHDIGGICRSLGRISRLPPEVFREVIPRLLEIGWLEDFEVQNVEVQSHQQNITKTVAESANAVAESANAVAESASTSATCGSTGKGITGKGTTNTCASDDARVGEFALAPPTERSANGYRPQWFAQWWAIYWRKVSRKSAEEAFQRHVKTEARFAEVMAATKRQTSTMMEREPERRPHGATWLNGERWTDEPAPPRQSANGVRSPVYNENAVDYDELPKMRRSD